MARPVRTSSFVTAPRDASAFVNRCGSTKLRNYRVTWQGLLIAGTLYPGYSDGIGLMGALRGRELTVTRAVAVLVLW